MRSRGSAQGAVTAATTCVLALLALSQPALAGQPAAADLKLSPFMVGLSVADIDLVTSWYVEKLGFSVTRDEPLGAGRVRFIEAGSQRIELLYVPGSAPAPMRALPPAHGAVRGYTHLTMEVPDLDAAVATLASRGVTPDLGPVPVKLLGVRVIFLRDPEGNLVEILQRLPN